MTKEEKSLAKKTPQSIGEMLKSEEVKAQFQAALPEFLTVDKFMRIAMTCIKGNKKLQECTVPSLLTAMVQSASLGLIPDPVLGQAYLIPYNNKGKMECSFQIGYKGLIALARRSGEINSISAQVVYTNDKFDFAYGTEERLTHTPAEDDRGEIRGVYAIAKFKQGGHQMHFMTKADVDAIRKRSRASTSGPWVTDYAEMMRKTVLKNLAKYLPLSTDFQLAAALDDRNSAIDVDTVPIVSAEEVEARFNDDTETDVISPEKLPMPEPPPVEPEKKKGKGKAKGCVEDPEKCGHSYKAGPSKGCRDEGNEYFGGECPFVRF